MDRMATRTRQEEIRSVKEELAVVRRAVDQLRAIDAAQRRAASEGGPLVQAARAVERALGIGR
jgi:hypothetical protein